MYKNIKEIRDDIDKLDRDIIELISKRAKLVHKLPDFKSDISEINDEERIEEIIQNVRKTSLENDLSPNISNDIYDIMIKEMIEIEIKEFKNKSVF